MRKDDLRDKNYADEIKGGEGRTGNPDARDQCRLGNLYFESTVYEYAIDAYKRAIQFDPSYATAHHNLGAVYYKMGLFDEAQQELESAIRIRPDIPLFHYTLGLVLKDDKMLSECIDSFSRAILLDNDYIEAYYRRGAAYFYITDPERARSDLGEVIKREPGFRDALYNLGVVYISLKRWDDARKIFLRQLDLKPDDADSVYYLSVICLEFDNDLGQAMSNLHKALKIDPHNLRSRFQLALLHARQRYKDISHREKAIEQLSIIIEMNKESEDFELMHDVFFLLGSLYDDNPEDIDRAIGAYEEGLDLADWLAEAHNNLGVLYSQKGLTDKAVREFRYAIELDPDYGNPYQNLAKIYFYQRNEEILKDFQSWIDEVSEDSARILLNLSLALMDVGRAEACESIYSRAHRIKNLLGVAGSKLRRTIREMDQGTISKLTEVLDDQEKCYNEMVSLLNMLKHEVLVLDMIDINDIVVSALSQIGFKSSDQDDSNQLCAGNVNLCLDLTENLPKIKGDHRKLKEAFSNIIINALEAMTEGGNLAISTVYSQLTSEIEIIFRDTGIGIPSKDLDNIFKPGYTTKASGSGFGLSITNRIISEHKGSIYVHSIEGEGTEMTIHIPVNLELAPIQTNLRMRPVMYEDPSKLISTEVDQIVNT